MTSTLWLQHMLNNLLLFRQHLSFSLYRIESTTLYSTIILQLHTRVLQAPHEIFKLFLCTLPFSYVCGLVKKHLTKNFKQIGWSQPVAVECAHFGHSAVGARGQKSNIPNNFSSLILSRCFFKQRITLTYQLKAESN